MDSSSRSGDVPGLIPFQKINDLQQLDTFLEGKTIQIGKYGGRRVEADGEKLKLKDIYLKFEELSNKASTEKDFQHLSSISSKIKNLQNTQVTGSRLVKILTKIKQFVGNIGINEKKRNAITDAAESKSSQSSLASLRSLTSLNSTSQSTSSSIEDSRSIEDLQEDLEKAKEQSKTINGQLSEIFKKHDNNGLDNETNDKNFANDPEAKSLRSQKTKVDVQIDKLQEILLDKKIQKLSVDDTFIEKVQTEAKKGIDNFFELLAEATKQTFGKEKPTTEDMIPSCEAALKGLKAKNPEAYEQLSSKIGDLEKTNAAYAYILGVAKDMVESK